MLRRGAAAQRRPLLLVGRARAAALPPDVVGGSLGAVVLGVVLLLRPLGLLVALGLVVRGARVCHDVDSG